MRWLKSLLLITFLIAMGYGTARLYYALTDGFTIGNISSALPYDPRHETKRLTIEQNELISSILSEKFTYLGKGCQSYVFLSEDGQYVLKFFKYQRFRPQCFLNLFSFIPWVNDYRAKKIQTKNEKLEKLYQSWRLAFNELQDETGVVYVHLNKSDNWKKQVCIKDKLGFEHQLDIDQMEFMIQRKVEMLCPTIQELMKHGDQHAAQNLLHNIMTMILSQYQKGYVDTDHALMQNTGVKDGYPIILDIGQLAKDESAKTPAVYKQDLFNKMYKFRHWLKERYPELELHATKELREIIGEPFETMQPHFLPHDEK